MAGVAGLAAQVDGWLAPLHGDLEPCGKDPEYDNDFLALNQAVAGKPESQFVPAEPPEWLRARDGAEKIFDRCRDLRVAIAWARATLNVDGIGALAQGLRLVHGLMAAHWDALHPQLDDGDPYARVNALALLCVPEAMLGELRGVKLIDNRTIGELSIRNVEVMLGNLPARPKEVVIGRDQIVQMLAAAAQQMPELRGHLDQAVDQLKALSSFLNEKLGVEKAPDVRPLVKMLGGVVSLMPVVEVPAVPVDGADPAAGDAAAAAPGAPARKESTLSGTVLTRADAIRAIDMVCDYLDRAEPTNPAQLLLRRSRRLINQSFLQLLKEFAPAALDDVARVMGVDPESVQVDKAP